MFVTRTFSSKYGGCEISISGKPKKIHMKFKYEEGNKEKPINKFKYYCDKEGNPHDNFDFSTKVKIIYRVDRVEGETRYSDKELSNKEVTIRFNGHSLGGENGIINTFKTNVKNRRGYSDGYFELMRKVEIIDDKCSPSEKRVIKEDRIAQASNIPTKKVEEKEPRLEVLASILHKVAHFENAGEDQTLLTNALIDMSKLDITKVIDKSDGARTTITLTIENTDGAELGGGEFLLFSVLPKKTTPTSKHVNFRIQQLEKVEDGETITTELKYSVRDNDPVIDWHFKNLGDGTITIVCPS